MSVIKVLVLVLLALTPVGAVPSVIQTAANVTRLEAVRAYFLVVCVIRKLFLFHGIKLSLRQLRRILRANDLYRNKNHTREDNVKDLISTETEDSAKCIGYRAMWRRLVNDHHVRVPRDRVLYIMCEIDPEGVRRRKAHMLVRRRYYARGANYVWHVDGYDKLKPFGFCIRCKVLSRHFEGFWTVSSTASL